MLSHLSIASVMFLPKLAVTAYLALQSHKSPAESHDSLQQIQSPLILAIHQNHISDVADYVIEIIGQPVATEHVDIKVLVLSLEISAN